MPVNQDKVPWTPELLALLGKLPDSELAKRLGCSPQAVSAMRRKLGIKSYSGHGPGICAWGQTELGLLRNFSDKEVARTTGRSLGEIAEKRKSL